MPVASPAKYRPWRVLILFTAVVIALCVWTFWPGMKNTPQLGLDLQGGTQVTLLPKPAAGSGGAITQDQLNQAVAIIRQRVDGLGVAEAEVTVEGTGSNAAIVVSVPGSVPQDRLVDLVGRTAQLAFRAVEGIGNPEGYDPNADPSDDDDASESPSATAAPKPTPTAADNSPNPSPTPTAATPTPSASPTEQESTPEPTETPTPTPSASVKQPEIPVQAKEADADFQERSQRLDCTIPENYAGGVSDDPDLWLTTCDRDGTAKYALQPAFILGTQVTNAQAQLDSQTNKWSVSLEFDSEGSKKLAEASTSMYQKTSPQNQFAIVLDGVVYSSPYFSEPITGGQAQITGQFTTEQAADLANVLKYGSLPVSLSVGQVTSITPTVGTDYLHAGLIAGAIGLLLVAIFLFLYYRVLGLVAVASLVLAGIISYCLFVLFGRQLGFTLTLAGVAGAIVSIGITADSFIVYFERIRDEIREGRSLRVAAEVGWVRARRTLLAADFVSFLGAVVLYVLSIGNVRGFAFALGLTTLVDVAVAFTFTRPAVSVLAATAWFQSGHKWTGVDPRRLGVAHLAPERPMATAGRR